VRTSTLTVEYGDTYPVTLIERAVRLAVADPVALRHEAAVERTARADVQALADAVHRSPTA
jgi:hypothetical protein